MSNFRLIMLLVVNTCKCLVTLLHKKLISAILLSLVTTCKSIKYNGLKMYKCNFDILLVFTRLLLCPSLFKPNYYKISRYTFTALTQWT